jgi:penicillin-binding protein 2
VSGAEAVFEQKLRGRDGRELIETDAEGRIVRTLGTDKEVPGEDVMLSLDARLNDAVAAAFPIGSNGAVIVAKPATGEILALYSSPSYSSDLFSLGMSTAEYAKLTEDPRQPLFNRAVGGMYPPGSTFKIITALAGLEEEAIRSDTRVTDVGVVTIGDFRFPNWYFTQYGKTEGSVDLVRAIQRSNDIFFYKTGEWLGITKLATWARRIGVGSPLGIELGGEASGLMPDPDWKNRRFTKPEERETRANIWYLGDTYHVAIGQGYLVTTPLQVNAWTNVIANQGHLCRPTILKSQFSNLKSQKENCRDLSISKETIALITQGMKLACEPGGTGWPLFNFNVRRQETRVKQDNQNETASSSGTLVEVPVACKTGTAEFGDPQGRTHAWFTAFAPLPSEALAKEGLTQRDQTLTGEPEISVTVLVEGGGEGSSVAAPVAKKILEEWFAR